MADEESARAARRAARTERRRNRERLEGVSGALILAHLAVFFAIAVGLSLLFRSGGTLNWNKAAYHGGQALMLGFAFSYFAQTGRRKIAWWMVAVLCFLFSR